MGLLLSFFLALFSFQTHGQHAHPSSVSQPPGSVQHIAQDLDSSFNVHNYEPVNVGWLTIQLYDASYAYINISGAGNFSTKLSSGPYLCSIHGQSFAQNTPTWIIIDAHTAVRVTWTTNVIVIDDEETY